MSDQKYTVDYFIEKFSSIPSNLWCVEEYTDGERCCALGHCGYLGMFYNNEAFALLGMFQCSGFGHVTVVNDGGSGWDKVADDPSLRILIALDGIKYGYDPRNKTVES